MIEGKSILQKRKGPQISQDMIKKLKQISKQDDQFEEFFIDFLNTKERMSKDYQEGESSNIDEEEESEDEQLSQFLEDKRSKNSKKQKANLNQLNINQNDKNHITQNINAQRKKVNIISQKLKQSSSSNDSSSSDSEVIIIEQKQKVNNGVSKKYQKIQEKEKAQGQKSMNLNVAQSKPNNPILAIFQKGETLKQNQQEDNSIKFIQSKNNQVPLSKQIQESRDNFQNTIKKPSLQNVPKVASIQKIEVVQKNVQKLLETNYKSIPKLNINPISQVKKTKNQQSSESSSDSSSSDDSESEISLQMTKKPKIQLSFQKQNNSSIQNDQKQQLNSKPNLNTTQATSNQKKDDGSKASSIGQSPNKTADQTPLKVSNKDHILNSSIKDKLDSQNKQSSAQKEKNDILENGIEKTTAAFKNISQNENDVQKINNINKSRLSNNLDDIPPFDLVGFEKINMKDVSDYEKTLNKNFFNENDQIYFKDIELDEELEIPKTSDWKKGTITKIINVSQFRVSVVNGTKIESQTKNTGIISFLYLKSYIEPIQDKKQQVVQRKEEIKQQNELNNEGQDKKQEQPITLRPNSFFVDNDKDIFIGRTVNYYYSNANYYKDKYIQEQSNKNEGNYMALDLLLNFPKIKKDVETIEQLIQILQNFMKKTVQIVNYELSSDLTMIRKKQINNPNQKGRNQGNQNRNGQKQNQNQSNQNKQNKQNQQQQQSQEVNKQDEKVDIEEGEAIEVEQNNNQEKQVNINENKEQQQVNKEQQQQVIEVQTITQQIIQSVEQQYQQEINQKTDDKQ